MGYTTLRQAVDKIAKREAFTGNSLSAENGKPYWYGRLNSDERMRLENDRDRIVYTVFSYSTPIAWVLNDGSTYRVSQKFSVTTSKHQGCLWRL